AAEAAKRQQDDNITAPAIGRVQSSLDYFPFFGSYPQVTAAGRAGFDYMTGRPPDFGEAYCPGRDIIRQQIKQKGDEMGDSNIPLDVAVGATALPARGVQAIPQAIDYGRQLWNASKIGGVYGAGYGWNESTGTWGEKAENAAEHGLGGMVAAPAFKSAVDIGA